MKQEELKVILFKALISYQKYFHRNSFRIRLGKNCITINFVAKKKFSRGYNLHLFEDIIWKMKSSIESNLVKNGIKNVEFWSASATDIQLVVG